MVKMKAYGRRRSDYECCEGHSKYGKTDTMSKTKKRSLRGAKKKQRNKCNCGWKPGSLSGHSDLCEFNWSKE